MKSYTYAEDESYLMENDDETQNMDTPSFEPNPADEINDDLIDLLNKDVYTFRCLECNYESDSRRGLKVHIGRKHKKTNF